jgi:hypothetical protein
MRGYALFDDLKSKPTLHPERRSLLLYDDDGLSAFAYRRFDLFSQAARLPFGEAVGPRLQRGIAGASGVGIGMGRSPGVGRGLITGSRARRKFRGLVSGSMITSKLPFYQCILAKWGFRGRGSIC